MTHVTALTFDVFDVSTSYLGEAVANLSTDGTGPVTVTVSWFVSPPTGAGNKVLQSQTLTLQGKTRYVRVTFADYQFSSEYCSYNMGAQLSSPTTQLSPSDSSSEGCPIT